jgi:hypothetical protein
MRRLRLLHPDPANRLPRMFFPDSRCLDLAAPLVAARRRRRPSARSFGLIAIACTLPALGCGTPQTDVVLDNDYPMSPTDALVVYRAAWQAVTFQGPIAPGSSSDPQSTIAASENTAYVVLAPGWDPASAAAPTSFVVLQSRQGFAVHLNNTLHIPVDDATFIGNCAAKSFLSQAQADFITQLVFPSDVLDAGGQTLVGFASLHYDAATCKATPIGDARAP